MVIHYNVIRDGISPETVITAWEACEHERLFVPLLAGGITTCVWFVPGTVSE
jgi:hypothetical protein